MAGGRLPFPVRMTEVHSAAACIAPQRDSIILPRGFRAEWRNCLCCAGRIGGAGYMDSAPPLCFQRPQGRSSPAGSVCRPLCAKGNGTRPGGRHTVRCGPECSCIGAEERRSYRTDACRKILSDAVWQKSVSASREAWANGNRLRRVDRPLQGLLLRGLGRKQRMTAGGTGGFQICGASAKAGSAVRRSTGAIPCMAALKSRSPFCGACRQRKARPRLPKIGMRKFLPLRRFPPL